MQEEMRFLESDRGFPAWLIGCRGGTDVARNLSTGAKAITGLR